MDSNGRRRIRAIKVHQWLEDWDVVQFDANAHRRKPDSGFYLFTLPASELRLLSGIYRRTASRDRVKEKDLGIQRRHEESRSEEIARFVRFGYPWSNLPVQKQRSGGFDDLRKPGWLPTAVVVNILKPSDRRLRASQVAGSDLVQVEDKGGGVTLLLPKNFNGAGWRPSQLHPLEVIDGQHRLWAFEETGLTGDFELPVVAFHGLDISWQAYLFWTINIKPKRINASLAFDLYPLLRSEDWLDKFEGHSIYRETRAQELTETLWSHPESPWENRINMLGEPGVKGVSQAAWIRSLMATYVKSFEGRGVNIGGLFGAPTGQDRLVLPWSRSQQAAFLIFVWQKIRDAISRTQARWTMALRNADAALFKSGDPAFEGQLTLLNQDQGVRAVLHLTNDLCFVSFESLKLGDWELEQGNSPDEAFVTQALKTLRKQPVANFVTEIAGTIADYDWRTATAPGLSEEERMTKLVFRGSGGYSEFRRQILKHAAASGGRVSKAARTVLQIID